MQVVGAGGPTGVAMSPARDMGPRLAHWVLPIRGKGSSEFLSYSCVPLPRHRCTHRLHALWLTSRPWPSMVVLLADPPLHVARWVPLTASMMAAVPAAFIVRGINHLVATGAAAPATETVGSG